MTQGSLIVPQPDSLAPCFTAKHTLQKPFVLGFDRMNLGKVTGLVAGSNAAKAGFLEGDTIVSFTKLNDLRADEANEMHIVLERDGKRLTKQYLPRGEAVDAWVWERSPAFKKGTCGL